MFKKLKFLMLLALFGLVVNVNGQTREDWSGTVSGKTYNSNTTVNLTGDVTLNGKIIINGVTLTIQLPNSQAQSRTISRGSANSCFFEIRNGGRLVINGQSDTKTITLDGGAKWRRATPSDGDICGYIQDCFDGGNPSDVRDAVFDSDYGKMSDMALIYSANSSFSLKYVVLENNYATVNKGGAIRCCGQRNGQITVENTIIRNCQNMSGGGGAVFFDNDSNSTYDSGRTATFTDCEIYGCADHAEGSAGGGAIRTHGQAYTALTMTRCNIHHCYSSRKGGGILWNVGERTGESYIMRLNNCTFSYNVSKFSGGGVSNEGKMAIEGCSFRHNKALGIPPSDAPNRIEGYGGGLYSQTYTYAASDFTSELSVDGSTVIESNEAIYGGGIAFMLKSVSNLGDHNYTMDFVIDGATVRDNTATINGGAIYIEKPADAGENYQGSFTMKSGFVYGNTTPGNGGAVYTEGGIPVHIEGGCMGQDGSGNPFANQAGANGGGFYAKNADVTMTGGEICNNTCVGDGGGFYAEGGNVSISGVDTKLRDNTATGKGGGFYSSGGGMTVTIAEASLSGNTASKGGGIYVHSTGSSTTTISDNAKIVSNKAFQGAGGYIEGGSLQIMDCDIDDNFAGIETNPTGDGGGFFVNGGSLQLSGGTIGSTYGNKARNGGGFYMQGGAATISDGTVQYNTADCGGGLYMRGTLTDTVKADFSNGSFRGNQANNKGGGIYIADYAKLDMTGESSITGNRVPSDSLGGGVFKSGGLTSEIKVGGASLRVEENYAGEAYHDSLRNNIYLDGTWDYLTIDSVSGISDDVQVGISIGKNLPKRVIRCTNFDVLNGIYMKLKAAYHPAEPEGGRDGGDASRIFDDASRYLPLFAGEPTPFTFDYIFFIETWDAVFDSVPSGFDPEQDGINSASELTYFMMIQNGIRCDKWKQEHGMDDERIKRMKVSLTGDIDLTGLPGVADSLYWRPVSGEDDMLPFGGEFHGEGHTITGMQTIDYADCSYYGMFGQTKDATIDNLSIQNCRTTSGGAKAVGMLVARMDGGTVANVIVSGIVDASGAGESPTGTTDGNCNVGGLVGETVKKSNAEIRNCVSMAYIDAGFKKDPNLSDKYYHDNRTVGGMVGYAAATTVIENGFVNLSLVHGSWNNCYVGGLVGDNRGEISNCYVRLDKDRIHLNQMPNDNAPDYTNYAGGSMFGRFAGTNMDEIGHCFAPDTVVFGLGTELKPYVYYGDLPENYADYGSVTCPYRYDTYTLDNTITHKYGAVEGDYLIDALNGWVDDQHSDAYSHWMRTKASPVNDDYPIPVYDNADAPDYGVVGYHHYNDSVSLLEYSTSFNEVLGRAHYFGSGALFVYGRPTTLSGGDLIDVDNLSDSVKIYIDDNVPVLQAPGNVLTNVYPCRDFNDAIRQWHLISSSLDNDSPIGFNYANDAPFSGDPNPCGAIIAEGDYASFYPQGITDMTDIDLYCFDEPYYHWINFKRNSASHWHMNAPDKQIHYDNEDSLVRGKGYLASFAKRTLLQAPGTLNNGEFTVDVTAKAGIHNTENGISAASGTQLKGYNLLGNPYQSYLDMTEFMEKNSGVFTASGKSGAVMPSYAIYDEGRNAFVQGMASTPSRGSYAPSGIIGIHQGFFVVIDGNAGSRTLVTFDNGMRLDDIQQPANAKRGGQPSYPLVNLMVSDGSGESDIAVVEFGRPQTEGAAKMKDIGADGKIYFRYGGDDFAMLNLGEATDHLPVHFAASSDGTYTMTWSTANADFSYLHLVDNMTGKDIDMLTSDSYTFTAAVDDYRSRFKLMLAYTGIGEDTDADPVGTFAFMHEGTLTVNGRGTLEVVDVCGRTIAGMELVDAQSTVSLPQAAQGLYVLRLTDAGKTRVQKIVVR